MTGGCGWKDSIDKAIAQIDETRKAIVGQSEAWRAALPKLVDQLGRLENQASGDLRGVVMDARNQVQDLVRETIKFTNTNTQEIIAKTGVEFRCNATFTANGVAARLQYLIDDLKFWKKASTTCPRSLSMPSARFSERR